MHAASENTVIGVVDDDASVRRALSRLIESMGMRVETFESPSEYLSHRAPRRFTCLLLDVHLPGMSGFELHRRIVEARGDTPVIFITAHPDAAARGRARTARAVALLHKPFDECSLLKAIDVVRQSAVAHDSVPATH